MHHQHGSSWSHNSKAAFFPWYLLSRYKCQSQTAVLWQMWKVRGQCLLDPFFSEKKVKNHSKSRTYFLFNHSYPIFINIADIKSEILLCFEQLLHKNWPFCAICWSWFLACNMSRFCCFDSEQLLISMVINRPRKPLKNIYHALLCSSLCLLLQVVETQFIFPRFLFRCISKSLPSVEWP